MSNLARKYQQNYEVQSKPEVRVKTIKRHSTITPGEKFLAMLLVVFIAIMAVQIITAQAEIYEVNKGIEDVKTEIDEQRKINGDLKAQVSDMSRYERVWNKAKELGLNLDENNVRVVEKK